MELPLDWPGRLVPRAAAWGAVPISVILSTSGAPLQARQNLYKIFELEEPDRQSFAPSQILEFFQ
jgi:hypothetical protein